MVDSDRVLVTHPSLLTIEELVHGDVNFSQGGKHRDELRKRFNGGEPELREYLRGYESWLEAKKTKINSNSTTTATPKEREWEDTETWLRKKDLEDPDPRPIGTLCKAMIASGWDFSGLRKDPEYARAFVYNEEMWPLSEVEMSVEQRRFWRVIVRQYQQFLRTRRPI